MVYFNNAETAEKQWHFRLIRKDKIYEAHYFFIQLKGTGRSYDI